MPEIRYFKKKPFAVPMLEWTGENLEQMQEFVGWLHEPDESPIRKFYNGPSQAKVYNTEELAWIPCPVGHFVAKGVNGEFYPISADVLAKTYEEVEAP
jgi:hypothetical protein